MERACDGPPADDGDDPDDAPAAVDDLDGHELVALVSHELRTPLTPILGFLELLERRGDNLTADQRRMLEIVRSNSQRMLRLVDDLLVLSRARAGRLRAQPADVPLVATATRVRDELAVTLPAVDLDVEDWHVVADPDHLHQILLNLLINAAKYGAPPVALSAHASADTGYVRIEVADHGPGIPAEFVDRMWERFSRRDDDLVAGTGLGLFIVRLLAQANAGSVSYRPGTTTGAVFVVELPGTRRPPSTASEARPRRGWSTARPEPSEPGPAGGTTAAAEGPHPHGAGDAPAREVATDTDEAAPPGPDEDDPERIIGWAAPQLLRAGSPEEATDVLVRVIHRLGGWTVPARVADDRALPLDLAFGTYEPMLPAADLHSAARVHLERHLPPLVESARRAVELLGSVDRLAHDASVDPLTGLANRRGISRILSRPAPGSALMVLDLDGFKHVNDVHGHLAGDRILEDFATCLRRQLRAVDHAGRLGGDEFVVLLIGTDEDGAERVLDRLRETWLEVRSHDVGFSAGVTTLGSDDPDALERADRALLAAKAAGKGVWRRAGDHP